MTLALAIYCCCFSLDCGGGDVLGYRQNPGISVNLSRDLPSLGWHVCQVDCNPFSNLDVGPGHGMVEVLVYKLAL